MSTAVIAVTEQLPRVMQQSRAQGHGEPQGSVPCAVTSWWRRHRCEPQRAGAQGLCRVIPPGWGRLVFQLQLQPCPSLLSTLQVNVGILVAVTRVISQISADNYKVHGDPSAFK